ncbi:MAG: cell envelope integrity EipB family protein [Sneathiellales bacterium]|nr:cell envelope integrity EipB family protein [Sneathiellales bacterium]
MLFHKLLSASFFAAFLLSLVSTVTYAAGPVPLASHRAVYDLSLKELIQSTGISDVRGRIVMEMENGCEGYILNQRMLIELISDDGGAIVSDFHISTFENKSGDTMRFTMSSAINGKTVEKSSGIASKEGEEGVVRFSDEEGKELKLPKGVLFPTAHTLKILQSAREGKNLVSAKVFDGNGQEGLQDSLTIIGKRNSATKNLPDDGKMQDMKHWPVRLTFFDLTKQQNEPDYEVALEMFENGVASDLILKYQDFSLNGELVKLEFLKKGECK